MTLGRSIICAFQPFGLFVAKLRCKVVVLCLSQAQLSLLSASDSRGEIFKKFGRTLKLIWMLQILYFSSIDGVHQGAP
jgi:hypothetical protein